jgi:hypothetical protein
MLLVLVLGTGAGSLKLFAQGTDLGTIRGTVTDSTGAAIRSAQVEITDLGTHTARQATTNERGEYHVPALPSGHYRVVVRASGFGESVVNGIVLNGSDAVSADAMMQVATSTTSVEVTSDAPIINTQDQSLSQTLDSKSVIEIPRDSRDVYSFLYINPNITQSDEPGDFKFIGAQSYGASFAVDGQRSNGGIFGQATSTEPTLEAVGDLNVLSETFSSEYAGIANIRVTTKRGGANYSGSLFYNNKNSALAAWTLADKDTLANFAPTIFQPAFNKPYFNITDVGGSFGGPVPKLNKTWFFAAYEHNWTVEPSEASSTSMPHPSLLGGDFSLLNDSAKPVVGSAVLSASEIANDTVTVNGSKRFIRIPDRLLNPVTTKLIGLYYPKIGMSAPINPANGRIPSYSNVVPGQSGQDMATLRIDHDFNEANHLYGVYHASAMTAALHPVVAPFTGLGLTQTDRRNNTLSLSYSHVFSPSIVNELRGGFNKQHLFTHSNTTLKSFLSSIGFSDADIAAYGAVVGSQELDTYGHMSITFGKSSTFQAFSNGGRNTDRPMDQDLITFGDTLTWSLGKHTIKAGADVVYNDAVDGFAVNRGTVRGGVTYSGTGVNALANFLQGNPANTAVFVNQARPPMEVSNWETGYFVQDDFHVSHRLTLNLGLRYELFTPFVDKNDLMANFDPNYNNVAAGHPGRFVIPSEKTLKYLDPNIIKFGYTLASQAGLGVGRGLVHTDKSSFGPRVGAAFQLTPKSVLRGGYGLYYPTSAAQGIRDPIATNPFNNGRTMNNPTGGWPTGGSGSSGTSPISGGTLKPFGNTPSANYVPVNLKNPRTQQWNATYEQQIPWQSSVRFSYIGGKQTGQVVGVDLDMIAPNDNPFGTTTGDGVTPCDPINNGDCAYSDADNARIKFPALGDYVLGYGNLGHSITSAFQAQAQRQANGLSFSVAYTYLDQNSSGIDTGNSSLGGAAYNPFQPNSDYGPESFTSRQRIVANGIYDLPVGHGRHYLNNSSRLMDAVVGGWQASTNLFAKSGTPYTPFWVCDDCDPIAPGNIASGAVDAVGDFNATSFRPVITGNYKNAPSGYQWNASGFGLPSIGSNLYSQAGVAKRNTLMGPGTFGMNLGLHKSFHVTERLSMQVGADIDNVFNHPMKAPDGNDGGGGGTFAQLGDFSLGVDQTTPPAPGQQPKLLPIDPSPDAGFVNYNSDFGRLYRSYSQEGVDSRRSIRLRARITF